MGNIGNIYILVLSIISSVFDIGKCSRCSECEFADNDEDLEEQVTHNCESLVIDKGNDSLLTLEYPIRYAKDIVKRAVVGVYEIATFPIPLPKDYEPIITDPEFILQKEELKP